MPNLLQIKQERMLTFLQKIKDEHRDNDVLNPPVFMGYHTNRLIGLALKQRNRNQKGRWGIRLGVSTRTCTEVCYYQNYEGEHL